MVDSSNKSDAITSRFGEETILGTVAGSLSSTSSGGGGCTTGSGAWPANANSAPGKLGALMARSLRKPDAGRSADGKAAAGVFWVQSSFGRIGSEGACIDCFFSFLLGTTAGTSYPMTLGAGRPLPTTFRVHPAQVHFPRQDGQHQELAVAWS